MSKFTDMFHQSPIRPLVEHMQVAMRCVGLVKPMFEAVRDGRYDELERLTKDVFKTEHEADIIKDEIRQTIPRTFYLPVFRGDLLGYLKLQDDMADSTEDLAYMLTLKDLHMPPAISARTMEYVDTVIHTCNLANALTMRFQKVFEQGFPPDEIQGVLEDVKETEKAEWESDRCQYKLSRELFRLENEISPVDIFLWSKIFTKLGKLANFAESLADRVRRMLTST